MLFHSDLEQRLFTYTHTHTHTDSLTHTQTHTHTRIVFIVSSSARSSEPPNPPTAPWCTPQESVGLKEDSGNKTLKKQLSFTVPVRPE